MRPTLCHASRGGTRRHPIVTPTPPPTAAERLQALQRPGQEAKV
jgi:hypothetical protein